MKRLSLMPLPYFALLMTLFSTGCVGNSPGGMTVPIGTLTHLAIPTGRLALQVGQSSRLSAIGTDAQNDSADVTSMVDWSSSDPTIATVSTAADDAGTVQAVAPGTVTITAHDPESGIDATAQVTVSAPPTSLSITSSSAVILAGVSTQLKAFVASSTGAMVDVTEQATWTSLNPAQITVSEIAGLGMYANATTTSVPSDIKVQITATYGGQTATLTITKDDGCGVPGASPFSGGSGTSTDPYLICSPDDLAQMAARYQNHIDTASYQLVQDIFVGNGQLTPIGFFNGTFDGNHHAITNFTIKLSGPGAALFVTAQGATITNLEIDAATISGTNEVAGVLAESRGGVTLDGVLFNGSVSATGNDVGGLIALVTGGAPTVIRKSRIAQTQVSTTADAVGGLVGHVTGGSLSIQDSYAAGQVQGGGQNTGGIIGVCEAASTLARVYSQVQITAPSAWGGIFGFNNPGALTSTSVYWDTDVTGTFSEGNGAASGAQGVTDSAIRLTATFVGWDFTTVWTHTEGVNAPMLQIEVH